MINIDDYGVTRVVKRVEFWGSGWIESFLGCPIDPGPWSGRGSPEDPEGKTSVPRPRSKDKTAKRG